MTKREAAIVGAYTGVVVGTHRDLIDYISELVGGPVGDATLTTFGMINYVKGLARNDFMALKVED